jgi:hypothetical protein
MKRIIAVLAFCCAQVVLSSDALSADELIIPVLGESWFVAANTPPLDAFQAEKTDRGFHYQGAASQGFNISCFVEKPTNDRPGHEACFEHYWPLAKRNPTIDQDSVRVTKSTNYTKVSYDTTIGPLMHHANYYLSHEGRWLDIHVSTLSTLPSDKILTTFEESLQLRAKSSLRADAHGSTGN